ncbi:MAG: hypothetical protein B5M56_02465 [Desulfococcus sp. 4484_241]|nr:MAG: hypothetical protein B5M56_02465 [Desulfococcus sp. 4484_241]
MALDEPRESDTVHNIDGLTFIMDSAFLEKAKPVKVDFNQFGFAISSSIELGGGSCNSCGSGSSCGS